MKNSLLLTCAILIGLLLIQTSPAGQLLANLSATPAQAAAQTSTPTGRTINVTGEAEVMVVPDEVDFTIGIQTRNQMLSMAQAVNSNSVKTVIDLVQSFGVAPDDIQTNYINISRDCYWCYAGEQGDYVVRNTITIKLRDISQFEDVLMAVSQLNNISIHSIEFCTSDLRKYRDQARELALKAAQEKAQDMTAAVGATAGDVLSIQELQNDYYSWYSSWYGSWGSSNANYSQNVMVMSEQPSAPLDGSLAPGRIAIKASVSVQFEIK